MHLFSDYIQPLTLWLHDHPTLALFITFLIALTESLAIVGSIVPGSVTMTAIGILAGSGVMRIDLTFLAATLGAIAGDSSSYLLGYAYSDRLNNIWPFYRYPNWLRYGKEYFAKHGGKSVLIGRFVGPLRSIIPVIAGMMHMSHWRFYIANIISAIAWAALYVLPGVLIGAASSELSPEKATRLFILILLLLAGMWLLSVGLKWLFIRINRFLRANSHEFWLWLASKRYLAKPIQLITPRNEDNHYPTVILVITLSLSILLLCIITAQVFYGGWLTHINQPIHLFLQSLRTLPFDIFFTIVAQITSPLTLICLLVSIVILTMYFYDWRSLVYWLSLNFFCALLIKIFHLLIVSQRPEGILDIEVGSSFPIPGLTFASATFLALSLYLNAYCQSRFNRVFKIILIFGLLLAGFTPLYMGDSWFTDSLGAYFSGISLGLIHWVFYRRGPKLEVRNAPYLPVALLSLLVIASTISCLFNYRNSMRNHQPYFAQYVFTDELWWNQTKPLLPIYRTNRIGQRISLFNIQYAGSLDDLEHALTAYGWQKQNDSLFNSILTRVSSQSSTQGLPFMAQLYLNKKPMLVMTYEPKDGKPIQVLRIWRSNYHLQHFRQPIWLGSVHPRALLKRKQDKQLSHMTQHNAFSLIYVTSALNGFMQRSIPLPSRIAKQQLPAEVEPMLLLIREPAKRESEF